MEYAPNAPNSPYPPTGATNIDHTTTDVTLSWSCSDKDGGVLCYDVYLDTLDPPLAVIASGIAVSSYFVDSLNFNTTYYWKVFAKDDQGVVTAGSVWSFSTLPHPNQAPSVPVYLAPGRRGLPGNTPPSILTGAARTPTGEILSTMRFIWETPRYPRPFVPRGTPTPVMNRPAWPIPPNTIGRFWSAIITGQLPKALSTALPPAPRHGFTKAVCQHPVTASAPPWSTIKYILWGVKTYPETFCR